MDERKIRTLSTILLVAGSLLLPPGSILGAGAAAGLESLESLFIRAQSNPALRLTFISSYAETMGLPDHVIRLQYSEKVKVVALTNPLRRLKSGKYALTTMSLSIGHGYPSVISFGPKIFQQRYSYAEFQNVLEHEAAHAKFWATGRPNYMKDVDTDQVRLVKGLLPVLFELDAIKTQMNHPSWALSSEQFREAQLKYRQKWLEKLKRLRQRSYVSNVAPLLERIWRNYREP